MHALRRRGRGLEPLVAHPGEKRLRWPRSSPGGPPSSRVRVPPCRSASPRSRAPRAPPRGPARRGRCRTRPSRAAPPARVPPPAATPRAAGPRPLRRSACPRSSPSGPARGRARRAPPPSPPPRPTPRPPARSPLGHAGASGALGPEVWTSTPGRPQPGAFGQRCPVPAPPTGSPSVARAHEHPRAPEGPRARRAGSARGGATVYRARCRGLHRVGHTALQGPSKDHRAHHEVVGQRDVGPAPLTTSRTAATWPRIVLELGLGESGRAAPKPS